MATGGRGDVEGDEYVGTQGKIDRTETGEGVRVSIEKEDAQQEPQTRDTLTIYQGATFKEEKGDSSSRTTKSHNR